MFLQNVNVMHKLLIQGLAFPHLLFLSFFKKSLFIWLCRVLVVAGGLLSCSLPAP